MALNEGTKVWTVAGGPAMSVKFEDTNGLYLCTWFDGKVFQDHAFSEAQLTTTAPESGISFSSKPKRNNSY